jgi:hypothetical protein
LLIQEGALRQAVTGYVGLIRTGKPFALAIVLALTFCTFFSAARAAPAWQASPPLSIPGLSLCITAEEKAVLTNLLSAYRSAYQKWSDAPEMQRGGERELDPTGVSLIFARSAYESALSVLQQKPCPFKPTRIN